MSEEIWAHRPIVKPDCDRTGTSLWSWEYGPVCHCERPWRHPHGCDYLTPRLWPAGALYDDEGRP